MKPLTNLQRTQSSPVNQKSLTKSLSNSPTNGELLLHQALQQLDESTRVNQQLTEYYEQQSQTIQENEIYIVGVFEAMLNATQILNNFSEALYQQTESLILYKRFRQLYESFAACSFAMYKVNSHQENFNQAKIKYINEQTKLFSIIEERSYEPMEFVQRYDDIIVENETLKELLKKYQSETLHSIAQEHDLTLLAAQNTNLKKEVLRLNQQLFQNNLDFSHQIKSYNQLLNKQQLHIQRLKNQKNSDDLTQVVKQLQLEVSNYKETSYRDQLLIDNMYRKLRILEKDRQANRQSYVSSANLRSQLSPTKSEKHYL